MTHQPDTSLQAPASGAEATAGPWNWAILGTGRDPLWVLESPARAVILTVAQAEFGPTTNPEANRALIAAAPDLLMALKTLVGACMQEDWDEPDATLDLARAAIAKAESR